MRMLYLRSVYLFNVQAGGSVGHTAGVINGLNKITELKVCSNDKLKGVIPKIEIIKPIRLKFLPTEYNEFLYNYKIQKKLKKKFNYECIYQRYSGFSFSGAKLSKRYNIPFILEFNSSEVWKIKNWGGHAGKIRFYFLRIIKYMFMLPFVSIIEKYNLKTATLINVVSEVLKENLVEQGIDPDKILVNPNGINPDIYHPEIVPKQIIKKEQNSKQLVGFIGTFGQWHGVEILAKAIVFYFDKYKDPDIIFLLIGDGSLMDSVKNIINASIFKNNVIFTGIVPQEEGPHYLSACDILLSPHVKNPDGTKFFGSPTKLFEYMAMEKPIIASDLDQIGQVLKHNYSAILVEPGNPKQLADAIDELLKNKEKQNQLAKNARKEALENYTWDIHTTKIISRLYEIIA